MPSEGVDSLRYSNSTPQIGGLRRVLEQPAHTADQRFLGDRHLPRCRNPAVLHNLVRRNDVDCPGSEFAGDRARLSRRGTSPFRSRPDAHSVYTWWIRHPVIGPSTDTIDTTLSTIVSVGVFEIDGSVRRKTGYGIRAVDSAAGVRGAVPALSRAGTPRGRSAAGSSTGCTVASSSCGSSISPVAAGVAGVMGAVAADPGAAESRVGLDAPGTCAGVVAGCCAGAAGTPCPKSRSRSAR